MQTNSNHCSGLEG